jgi:uncharacterized protein YhbP (UPF0306 family)
VQRTELKKRIEELLAEQNVLTLAVADAEGQWASPVYYASDGIDLFFVSDPASRHCRAAAEGRAVAGSVHDDSEGWQSIRGLQMEGTVTPVAKADLQNAMRIYEARFTFTRIFFEQFDKLDPELARRAALVRFYRFRPRRIVLVDNTVHFGFHAEWREGEEGR